MSDLAYQIERMEERAILLKNQVTTMDYQKLIIFQKKYLEALKKYEEVIQAKRDMYGEKSETVSCKKT